MRRHLTRWLQLLVDRGAIPRARCPELRGSNNHKAIATDLIVLVKFLSADCDSRELAIPGTVEQLEAARALGDCLLRVAEVQGKRMLAEQAARELRDRAFTGAP